MCQGLPIQDGQPRIKNFPLKMVNLISKALIIIFLPDEMRLEIRKCIGISKVLQSVQILQFSMTMPTTLCVSFG